MLLNEPIVIKLNSLLTSATRNRIDANSCYMNSTDY